LARISGGRSEALRQEADAEAVEDSDATETQLANLNRDVDDVVEVTSEKTEGFELYVSDTSVREAFKAGGKLAEVAAGLASHLNEPALATALSEGDLDPLAAIKQLQNCNGRQGFNWTDFFVSPAYASSCELQTISGRTIVVHDTDSCLWALMSASYHQAEALATDELYAGLKTGVIQQGEEFYALVTNPGLVLEAAKGLAYDLIADPEGTAIRLGKDVVDDLQGQAYEYLAALNEQDYETAGILAAGLAIKAATKVIPGVGQADVALTTLKKRVDFKPIDAKLSDYATNRGSQIALNRQNGAVFENQIVDALSHVGSVKNGTPVTVTLPSGKQVTTIPDLWGRNTGGILEVKNVQGLSNSNQLRAQLQLAEETGTPFNLVVSPRTQNISGPLRDRIDEVTSKVGGGIYRYDPSTGDLSNF